MFIKLNTIKDCSYVTEDSVTLRIILNPWQRITVPLGYNLTNLSPQSLISEHRVPYRCASQWPVNSRPSMATHGFYGSIPRVTKRSVDINKDSFMAGHKRALNARCHVAIPHLNGSRSCPKCPVALPSPEKKKQETNGHSTAHQFCETHTHE